MDYTILFSFVFGCILIRLLFVVVAYKINKKYLPILGFLALIPAFGFLLIYFGCIKRNLGAFKQDIWWNNLRIIHASLYLCFFILAINKSKYSYVPLLVDVFIGACAFMIYHYTKNMNKYQIEPFKSRTQLLQKCGLLNISDTDHCFADGTHHTCCMLGPKARKYADESGNPIGKASQKASLIMGKNNKLKPWCTCTGSEVCSYYAKKFNDGTKIKLINDPNSNKIVTNVSPEYENYYKQKFRINSHNTPGIV